MQIYKIIGRNSLFDILGTVIENRKIKDTEKFFNYSKKDVLSPYLLKNMDLGVRMFKKHQMNAKESKTTVLIDSDP